jgi:SAM-dependent methyltransferase
MPKKPRPLANIQSSESQTYTGTQQLLDSETGLIGYSSEIVRKFYTKMELHNRISKKGGNLLEFGAGTGFLAEIFRTKFNLNPDCLELDPNLVKLIKNKEFRCFQFLSETPKDYAAIYTSNVLEHIENDTAVLKELYEALIPGGIIGIYVPAHPILYSTMDQEIGHVRRYTRSELRKKVLEAGFSIQSLTYDESIGFFASALVKIIGYKSRANLGTKKSLVFYDKIVYPISCVLDKLGFRFFLGKNLILIATKTRKQNDYNIKQDD